MKIRIHHLSLLTLTGAFLVAGLQSASAVFIRNRMGWLSCRSQCCRSEQCRQYEWRIERNAEPDRCWKCKFQYRWRHLHFLWKRFSRFAAVASGYCYQQWIFRGGIERRFQYCERFGSATNADRGTRRSFCGRSLTISYCNRFSQRRAIHRH